MSIDPHRLAGAIPLLEKEDILWIATVRADGRPHLVPIWFVWHTGRVWICTPLDSQKVKNIEKNPSVSLALGDGANPLILEGEAALRLDSPWPDELGPLFKRKYDWDFRIDNDADYVLVEITLRRRITWS